MTPATAQSLTFESEGNTGNAHENFREIIAVESFRRRGRLEDSVRTAGKLGAIANASGDDRACRSIDTSMAGTAARPTRKEDRAVRRESVSQDAVS